MSEILADYTKIKFKDLPEKVVLEAKRCLLDTIGYTIAGHVASSSKFVRDFVVEIGGKMESTIIGDGTKIPCQNAALVNGTMARYWDYNDGYLTTFKTGEMPQQGCHPSETILTILAVAERQHSSGKELIEAIVISYELMCRLCDSLKTYSMGDRGFHHSTFSTVVVPVVVGKLLRLNKEQIINAIGISASWVALHILDAMSWEPNTMAKNIACGFAGQRGITATLLAQKGFTGPTTIIEGRGGYGQVVMGDYYPEKLIMNKKDFKILKITRKIYPTCGAMKNMLEATHMLVKEHDILAENVEKITITGPTRAIKHCRDQNKFYLINKESADHSLPFLISILLLYRTISPEHYTIEKITDPLVSNLMERVIMVGDPELNPFYPAAIVEIETKSGTKFSRRIDHAKGHHKNPMSDEELKNKFISLVSNFINEKQIEDIIKTVYNLEKIDDTNGLMELMVFK